MEIKLSGIVNDSIVDGPGMRLSVFTQGCPHHCSDCHNPQTHDPEGGFLQDTSFVLNALAENPLLDGVTLSGGEPFEQPLACEEIARGAKTMGLDVWVYTGYTVENLLQQNDPKILSLLKQIDVLIDGPFEKENQSLDLLFCGSTNQRLIDVKKSLSSNTITLWENKSYF